MTERTKSILLIALLCLAVAGLCAPLYFSDDPVFMPHLWRE